MVSHTCHHDQFIGHDCKIHKDHELMAYGTHECAAFRKRILAKYSPLASAIKAEYLEIAQRQSYVQANLRLLSLDKKLHIRDFNLLSESEEVSRFAEEKASTCLQITSELKVCDAYKYSHDLAESYGLTPPSPEKHSGNVESCLARLCCSKWWKRNLSRLARTTVEAVSRELKQVHTHATPYCSNVSLKAHQYQKKSNREFLESMVAVNEEGYEKTLAELSDLGVSNPSIRRLELITRCKGYEVVAKEMGHESYFITLTAPSRFHRMTCIKNKSREVVKVVPNGKFDGSTPRDTQEYLRSTWAKIQAKFHREGIRPYGFRVAEPHHDGTPHWHFLLFVDPERSEEMITIFRRWALLDSPKEVGAAVHRLDIVKIQEGINPETGREYSATAYIIKYISKNIDGHGINNNEQAAQGNDWSGTNPHITAERIEAWARTNRIRQFQPIGGPSVTVWRELRRLSEQDGLLEKLRETADSGDWAAFVQAMGGPNVARKNLLVRPVYAQSEKLNRTTGEITPVTHTEYGDEARERVVGILIAGVTVLSRTHFWEIKENVKAKLARQQIMNGIANLIEKISDQNQLCSASISLLYLQQAEPAALDLCQ